MADPSTDIEKTQSEKLQSNKTQKHGALRKLLYAAVIILAFAIVAVGAVNVYVRITYYDFYDHATKEFPIPGIAEGFIAQDLDYLDETDTWLFSGYVGDGEPSPVYKRNSEGEVCKLYIEEPDGAIYSGHGSGITSEGGMVYLTCERGYMLLSADDIANAKEGDTVKASKIVDLDFTPAFLNTENGNLYAGNFYFPEKYETPQIHRILTTDGQENPAVLYQYAPDPSSDTGFADVAERVYSIPGKTQGVAISNEGRIVLSTSYGLSSSELLVYNVKDIKPDDVFVADGEEVPLFILDSRVASGSLIAPPMTEGIETHDDRIYISEESASDKYLFGKLYDAGNVVSVEL